MASHTTVTIMVANADNAEQQHAARLTIRTDILLMQPGRRRDATLSITMQRLVEAFWAAYNSACAEPEKPAQDGKGD